MYTYMHTFTLTTHTHTHTHTQFDGGDQEVKPSIPKPPDSSSTSLPTGITGETLWWGRCMLFCWSSFICWPAWWPGGDLFTSVSLSVSSLPPCLPKSLSLSLSLWSLPPSPFQSQIKMALISLPPSLSLLSSSFLKRKMSPLSLSLFPSTQSSSLSSFRKAPYSSPSLDPSLLALIHIQVKSVSLPSHH